MPQDHPLDPATQARLDARVLALPPLTDEQLDGLADVLLQVQLGTGR